jgi:aspartyl-tRNA(Asn)/glutamyl-tRNA(Gln) amidotransferase subunit A
VPDSHPYQLTAHELLDKYRAGEAVCLETVESLYGRIDEVEPRIKGYLSLWRKKALAEAADVDERIRRGDELRPLEGVPVALKDLLCTTEGTTTCASRILDGFESLFDATVVTKLKEAGAIVIGKTNMDEFAMGSSTENSAYALTANPWDTDRVPGGSSGGSAAVVAADETIIALGSDTGGSIRQPASFCGIVGLKPTYGRVSRSGLVAFASSLDQIGPMTKDVTDCALTLSAISGHDPMDSTSVPEPVPDYLACLDEDLGGVKVGVPEEYFGDGLDADVRALVETAIERVESLGATRVNVSLPHTEYAVPVYYIIAPAEASANLARFDGVRYGHRSKKASSLEEMYMETKEEGFGPEVKRRIMLGTYALSSGYYDAYYLKAQKVRTLLRRDFDEAFAKCDVLLTPTSPTVAFRAGERTSDPLEMYLSDIFTISANLAGLPCMSVPCGYAGGMPVGLQIIGRTFDESTVLKAAYAYEQNSGIEKLRPALDGT